MRIFVPVKRVVDSPAVVHGPLIATLSWKS